MNPGSEELPVFFSVEMAEKQGFRQISIKNDCPAHKMQWKGMEEEFDNHSKTWKDLI